MNAEWLHANTHVCPLK